MQTITPEGRTHADVTNAIIGAFHKSCTKITDENFNEQVLLSMPVRNPKKGE